MVDANKGLHTQSYSCTFCSLIFFLEIHLPSCLIFESKVSDIYCRVSRIIRTTCSMNRFVLHVLSSYFEKKRRLSSKL